MSLTSFKVFLCRNDVKIFIMCAITGGILQLVVKQYIKNHPEFLEHSPLTKKPSRRRRYFSPRGGALIEISGISVKIAARIIVNFIAKKAFQTGIAIGSGRLIRKIPVTAVSKYVSNSF